MSAPANAYRIGIADSVITAVTPSGGVQTLPIGDVAAVYVETNALGPWGLDVWWSFIGQAGNEAIRVPLGAEGEAVMLESLALCLPGFAVRGMNATHNARHLCWQKPRA